MGKESSARIQESILSKAEKKALVWLAERQPDWVTSDTLTYIGVFGTVIYAIGGALSNNNVLWLWLSCFGLLLHWYGDSLDGSLARYRNTQRPVYGFFIDHTLDAVTTCLILLGVGLSPMLRMDIALGVLCGYLSLSIYTYVCTIVKNEFKISYGFFGPTEFRLLLVVLNVLYMYTNWSEWSCMVCGMELGVFDIVGLIIVVILFAIYLVQFLTDRAAFAKKDPLPPYKKK